MMRGCLLLLAAGCRQVLGIDVPALGHDAGRDGLPIDTPVDTPLDVPLGTCPTGYTDLSGTGTLVYRGSTNNKDWQGAVTDCLGDDALATGIKHTHLVVIATSFELLAVKGVAINDSWIGLSDGVTEGSFLWVTDEGTNGYPPATGAPWASTEPTGSTSENCVSLNHATGELGDTGCGNSRRYICECDDYPNDPTHY